MTFHQQNWKINGNENKQVYSIHANLVLPVSKKSYLSIFLTFHGGESVNMTIFNDF